MELILPAQRTQMLCNFMSEGPDHAPVVKWFCSRSGATWLLSEMAADDEDILFGLNDLGWDAPEFDHVSRAEVEADMGIEGLEVERDIHFKPLASLSVYAKAAQEAGTIVTDPVSLLRAYQALAEEAKREGQELQAKLLSETNGEASSFPLFTGLTAIR